MTTNKPSVSPDGRYELRDVARLLDVNKSTVLRWTRQGHMTCQVRKGNHRQVWTGNEILRFWRENM